jgi:hypothetical protein
LRSGLLSRRSPRSATFTGLCPGCSDHSSRPFSTCWLPVCSWLHWPSTKPLIVTTDRHSPSQSALLRYRKPTRTRGRSGQCESSQHGRTQLKELVPAATRCVRSPTCTDIPGVEQCNAQCKGIAGASASFARSPHYRPRRPSRLTGCRRRTPPQGPPPPNRDPTEMGRRVTGNRRSRRSRPRRIAEARPAMTERARCRTRPRCASRCCPGR